MPTSEVGLGFAQTEGHEPRVGKGGFPKENGEMATQQAKTPDVARMPLLEHLPYYCQAPELFL